MPVLPEPRTQAGRDGLAALLANAGHGLVATDYDGTLAPVVDDPEQAAPAAGAVEALLALVDEVGTLAVVTGRPADVAVRLAGLERVPRLVVLGSYGAQRWQDGRLERAGPGLVGAVLEDVRTLVDRLGAPRVRVEDKGSAVAVHVRGCEEPLAALDALRDPLTDLAQRHGLVVEPGRLVLELRPPGTDKGAALRRLAAERGSRAVLFIGDDLGDLAAFGTVVALREEGVPGLTVASRSAESPEVAAAADLVVDGPAGVVALLQALAEAVRARREGEGQVRGT